MADDEKERQSAETKKPAPVGKPAAVPDQTPTLYSGERPLMEKAHWTLGVVYYGSHIAASALAKVQEHLFPLVQPYL
ncbi:hypothetical protein [Streptomyces sp. Ru87]|uniref:hypothetical protein n=1 Tax=Streptomyces TaxID=1883 RepID=UPI000BF6B80D|nr:hypothetical protein [Streptomyces sp. Ru87]PGH52269.1 hypothetical protein CRI70_02275 [Streptomyces sp. Ru87]